MMRHAAALALCLALAGGVAGQPARPMLLETDASEALLHEGRTALLNFRLVEAEQVFARLAARPDGAVAARYHLTVSAFLKALVSDEPIYFDTFFEHSDALNALLDEAPPSAWRTYLRAEDHLNRAIAAGKTERYVRGALAGRSAFHHFEKALAEHPTFYDSYKGMGLFHVLLGSLPSSQQRLLRILGFGGSVRQGLAELRLAADSSHLHRAEATLYLGLTDILLNESQAGGVAALAGLHAQFPESPLFTYFYGYALLANRRAAEAEPLLRAAVEAGTRAEYFFIDYAAFYLAQAAFRQDRFAEAEQFYRFYLRRHRGAALKALAYLELGLALELQGRRDEALDFYRKVEGARIYDSDVSAYRAARRRLAAPLTAVERDLLLGRNAYDAGRYEAAERHLVAARDAARPGTAAHAEAAYRLGRVYQGEGRLAEALAAHRYVVSLPRPDPTARWAPWSQFHVGQILGQQGQPGAARAAYEAALAYDGGFDYHQSLEQKARVALDRLQDDG